MDELFSGIVTTSDWTCGPNGEQYRHFYSEKWRIVTDAQMPIEKFRSAEHWCLMAYDGPVVEMIIPGCRVNAWVRTEQPPDRQGVCILNGTDDPSQ
jgi:hypothetical protein